MKAIKIISLVLIGWELLMFLVVIGRYNGDTAESKYKIYTELTVSNFLYHLESVSLLTLTFIIPLIGAICIGFKVADIIEND